MNESIGGLWAHLLDAEGAIEYQIEILRRGPRTRWLVQYFSFATGEPTKVGLIEEDLLCDQYRCVLYQLNETMLVEYEKNQARRALITRPK